MEYPYNKTLEEQFGNPGDETNGLAFELLTFFNKQGNTRYGFNRWRRELAEAVKEFDMDDLKRVIEFCSSQEWRRGKNGGDWFTINRLFGNKKKTEELIEQSRSKDDYWEVC